MLLALYDHLHLALCFIQLPPHDEPMLTGNGKYFPAHNLTGDNTLTYYFRVAELERLAQLAGLEGPVSEIRQEGLNRKTGVVLRRRFVQAKWKKLPAAASLLSTKSSDMTQTGSTANR